MPSLSSSKFVSLSAGQRGPSVGQMVPVYQRAPVYQRGPVYQRRPSLGQISPLSVEKYFPGQRGAPSFNTRVPSVGHRTTCRSDGPSVYQNGPSFGHRGPYVYQRGPSFGQSSPPSVKKIFFVRGALRRLTREGPTPTMEPSVGQTGPCVYNRGPSVGQRRGPCRSD